MRVADFDGPLGLLLSLIESRRLDVLTVPLGALAGAYLEALAALPVERLGNVSAFVAVASQLILIKSRALLPRQPVVAVVDADDGARPGGRAPRPTARLPRPPRRRPATRGRRAAGLRRLFRREPSVAQAAGRAGARPAPAPPLPVELLRDALRRWSASCPPPPPPPELLPRTVTIAQRVEIIRAGAPRHADAIVLQDLLEGVRDRVVRAVTFLAMLELVKRREITVEQAEPWGPIVARSLPAADASP